MSAKEKFKGASKLYDQGNYSSALNIFLSLLNDDEIDKIETLLRVCLKIDL